MKEALTPRSKELIVLAGLLFSVIVFWLSAGAVFEPSLWIHVQSPLWSMGAALLLLMVCWGLSVVLVESTITFVVAWALASFAGVFWYSHLAYLAASSVLFVFGVIAYFRARREMQRVYTGGLFRPLRRAIPLMSTFLVLAVAVAFYTTAPTRTLNVSTLVPEPIFIRLLDWATPVLNQFFPRFRSDITFDGYALELVRDQVGAKMVDQLTEPQRHQLIETMRKDAGSRYGFEIDGNATFGDIIYRAALKFFEKETSLYASALPFVFSFSLFVALRLLVLPIYLLAISIVALIVKLLVRLKVVELRIIPTQIVMPTFL